jgi:hypothetical protein
MGYVLDAFAEWLFGVFDPQLRRKRPIMFWTASALALALPVAIIGLAIFASR